MDSRRVRVAAIAARGATRAARFAGGRASVLPGNVALRVEPKLNRILLSGRRACFVSGTNGKTTTTAFVAATLGGKVATNRDGANLPTGWATALLDADRTIPAVLEVDEAYLPHALEAAPAAVVVLLNLSRDQLDRHSETRMLAQLWQRTLARYPNATVIANADDPLVVWAARAAANIVWAEGGADWFGDAATCPECGRLLERDAASTPIDWWCSCGLRRPPAEIARHGPDVIVRGTAYPLKVTLPGRANRGNATMALAAASAFSIEPADALAAIASVQEVSGRYAHHVVDGRETSVLLAKNPAGWVEVLEMIDEVLPDGRGTVVVAVNAHGPDGRDPSWLWDVPFEQLAGRKVIATGERATDLAVRLDCARVDYTKDTSPPLEAARHATEAPIVIAATYTNFLAVSRELAGRG